MAGIKDVAKRAKVGVGTVSRMINNSGYVAEETREKIEKAMKELDYTPNELARNLYRKRSGIIAVIVPNITSPFFSAFIDNVEAYLYETGYKMMVCNTARSKNAELEYLDMLNRHIVDGIITGVHTLDIDEYGKIKKPIVSLDRYLGDDIPIVTVDHKKGGHLAAQALVGNGCRRVLHFKGSTAVGSPYHERHIEFDRVMKENGIEVISHVLEWNRMDLNYYRDEVARIFAGDTDFDGVFAVDELAIACMNEAVRRNMRIPEDLKIIAYDGTYVTEMVEPKMTAIVQPVEELAKNAVRLLEEIINGNSGYDMYTMLDVYLRQGGTTEQS